MSDPGNWATHDLRRAVLVGLAYFTVVFAAGFVFGTLRVFLLSPWLGEIGAVLIELSVILAVAWVACHRLVAAFDVPSQLAPRLMMGSVAFLILMSAELGLSALVFGRTVADHLDQYREVHAFLGLAGQVAFGIFPLMQLRRGPRS